MEERRADSSGPNHPWVSHVESRIFEVVYPPVIRDPDLERYFAAVSAWWRSNTRHVCWLLNGARILEAHATQRRNVAEFDRSLATDYRRCGFAKGLVLPTAFQRGIATASHWMAPPPYPWVIVPSRDAALEWLRAQDLRFRTGRSTETVAFRGS